MAHKGPFLRADACPVAVGPQPAAGHERLGRGDKGETEREGTYPQGPHTKRGSRAVCPKNARMKTLVPLPEGCEQGLKRHVHMRQRIRNTFPKAQKAITPLPCRKSATELGDSVGSAGGL